MRYTFYLHDRSAPLLNFFPPPLVPDGDGPANKISLNIIPFGSPSYSIQTLNVTQLYMHDPVGLEKARYQNDQSANHYDYARTAMTRTAMTTQWQK